MQGMLDETDPLTLRAALKMEMTPFRQAIKRFEVRFETLIVDVILC